MFKLWKSNFTSCIYNVQYVYVQVQFYQILFSFVFLAIVIYDNEFKTKENKI